MFRRNRRLIPLLTVLCMLIGLVGYIFFFRISIPENELMGNSTGNLLNGGLFAQKDRWIFYSNPADGRKLYKLNLEDSQNIRLTDAPVSRIHLIHDWVYYLEGYSAIKMIDMAGKKQRTILKESVMDLVVRDKIYYLIKRNSTLDGIYSRELNGRNRQLITLIERVNRFTLDGDNIFMSSGSPIVPNVNGSVHVLARSTDQSHNGFVIGEFQSMESNLLVRDQWLYYTDGLAGRTKLYKMNLNTAERFELSDKQVGRINLYENYIIYSAFAGVDGEGNMIGKIYRCDMEGDNEVQLYDAYLNELHILDGWLYFTEIDRDTNQLTIHRINVEDGQAEKISL